MDIASKNDILALKGQPTRVKLFEIPALGKSVYIREVMSGERDLLEALTRHATQRPLAIQGEFRAKYAVHFLSDEQGARLFSDAEVSALDALPQKAVDEIFQAGIDFNEFRAADEEELEKNSQKTQN